MRCSSKSIVELQDEGIRAEASRKGRDSVNHGIQLLQNYKIIVHPRCKEFWKEVTNYCSSALFFKKANSTEFFRTILRKEQIAEIFRNYVEFEKSTENIRMEIKYWELNGLAK